MNQEKKGTLYGVGVGPGDPMLLTRKAVAVVESTAVIFAASSPKNSYSRALNVVQELIPKSAEVRLLRFPMTRDPEELEAAWQVAAREVLEVLDSGRDAAFVTIGDSLTYSTYGYLIRTLQALDPQVRIETVPGVTSYHAAAARMNLPLVESEESLLVLSGVSSPEEIARIAPCAENIVILKTYRNYDKIVEALEGLPEKRTARLVSNCHQPGEVVDEDAFSKRGEKMPYLSLIISKMAED